MRNVQYMLFWWQQQTKNYEFSCRVSNKKLSFCVRKQCLEIWQINI